MPTSLKCKLFHIFSYIVIQIWFVSFPSIVGINPITFFKVKYMPYNLYISLQTEKSVLEIINLGIFYRMSACKNVLILVKYLISVSGLLQMYFFQVHAYHWWYLTLLSVTGKVITFSHLYSLYPIALGKEWTELLVKVF